MTELVDSSIAQYAVIEARRTEGPSECFVIAYPDKESLRDLIAGPSIIACGFATREEAQAKVDADFWTAAAWERTCRGLTVVGAEEYSPRNATSRFDFVVDVSCPFQRDPSVNSEDPLDTGSCSAGAVDNDEGNAQATRTTGRSSEQQCVTLCAAHCL
jgi:hypothetical protein